MRFGILDQDSLAQVYASADVFVFPSRSETFGLVMLEAMACGTPVAVSRRWAAGGAGGWEGGAPLGGVLHDSLWRPRSRRCPYRGPRHEPGRWSFTWAHAARLFQQYLVPAAPAHWGVPVCWQSLSRSCHLGVNMQRFRNCCTRVSMPPCLPPIPSLCSATTPMPPETPPCHMTAILGWKSLSQAALPICSWTVTTAFSRSMNACSMGGPVRMCRCWSGLRYLCIVSSNLDEFFEVRAAAHHGGEEGDRGIYTAASFEALSAQVHDLVERQYALYNEVLVLRLRSMASISWRMATGPQSRGAGLMNILPARSAPVDPGGTRIRPTRFRRWPISR